MIFSSLCPFLGIRPPSAFVQRTTSENQTQLSCCLIFGFWVRLVACFQGMRTRGGAVGVGRAATSSVVLSSLFVILADVVLVKVIIAFFP
jgi:phospholipid/cholesterol/gamma-HCH transport system permease protein